MIYRHALPIMWVKKMYMYVQYVNNVSDGSYYGFYLRRRNCAREAYFEMEMCPTVW